nr:GLIPR1-like protein 1 [Pogona vitticeps]
MRWLWLFLQVLALDGAHGVRRPRARVYPKITNRTFINQYLEAHNRLRSQVDPPASDMFYVTWDIALARTARAWGKRCIFEHNPFRMKKGGGHPESKFQPPGENLWFGSARRRPFNATDAVNKWYSEVESYSYHNNSCTQLCSQYNQVIWAATYKVGCSVVFCSKFGRHRNIEYFVCNYGPRGKYPLKPYKAGPSCSACPEGDTCENNLCRNPEREKENSARSARWYPPWGHWIICDDSCIAVALLRPSLMFIVFAAVCYLQRYQYLSWQE